MGAFPLTRLLDRSSAVFLILLAAFAVVIPTLNLLVPASSGLHGGKEQSRNQFQADGLEWMMHHQLNESPIHNGAASSSQPI